jgi:hypothetical protein
MSQLTRDGVAYAKAYIDAKEAWHAVRGPESSDGKQEGDEGSLVRGNECVR